MGKDDSRIYLGVDLGGTNIQVGALDANDKIIAREKTKTKADKGEDEVVSRIAGAVSDVLKDIDMEAGEVGGLGIGAPGAIDFNKGIVLEAVNLRWTDYPLKKKLESEIGIAVTLDNDVNVGTWGEFKAGAAKGKSDVLGVFVGTGIGGGLVLGGKLFHGAMMTAGEIGHTVLRADAPFGRRTLEQNASRTASVNLITQLIEANHESEIYSLTDGDMSKVKSKVLAKAVEKDDALAVEVLRQSARDVGIASANAVTLLSLEAVVLGGGVVEALGAKYVDWARESFLQHVFPPVLRKCQLLESKLGDDAGLMGAALLAREVAREKP